MKAKLAIGALIIAGLITLMVNSHSDRPQTLQSSSAASESNDPLSSSLDNPSDPGRQTFDGDPCTEDCSGHEAGYRWAEDHQIDDVDDCDTAGETSNSPSFAEGCRDYVNGLSDDEGSDGDSEDDPNI